MWSWLSFWVGFLASDLVAGIILLILFFIDKKENNVEWVDIEQD